MFGKAFVRDLMVRSAESDEDRRRFLKSAGVAGLGLVGAAAMSGTAAASGPSGQRTHAYADAPSDGAILNFALNLEGAVALSRVGQGSGGRSSCSEGEGEVGEGGGKPV